MPIPKTETMYQDELRTEGEENLRERLEDPTESSAELLSIIEHRLRDSAPIAAASFLAAVADLTVVVSTPHHSV